LSKFLDFKAIKAAVFIEDAANLLKLTLKKSGAQFRAACPACRNDDERTIVLTPARGLFYCFDAKVGGDCLALVQHITGLEVQEAAQFLAPQEATVPPAPTRRVEKQEKSATKKDVAFDPVKFAASLAYSENVAALGISEADAETMAIGEKRGKVYVPVRWPSGSIAGWQYTDESGIHFPRRFCLTWHRMFTISSAPHRGVFF
jgi:DNA primase